MSFTLTSIIPSHALAQSAATLPAPGALVPLSPGFVPVMLKGIKVYPEDPFKIDFILDSGNSGLTADELTPENEKLSKYFLAALTTPEDDLWVNLSPYENSRIVPQALGEMAMGRDLLAQDYILKQVTASLIVPESPTGRIFWAKVYAQAYDQYGTTDVPVDTFNKVWIMPEKAVIYEDDNKALLTESHLKVMLDEDYTAQQKNSTSTLTPSPEQKSTDSTISSAVAREILIPLLEKEVNEGANFVQLRQMFHAMVLATWYKQALKDSILNKIYADKKKTNGLTINDLEFQNQQDGKKKTAVEAIYNQYVEAYKKGVCNLIREEEDPVTRELIPRKYFSGGFSFDKRNLSKSLFKKAWSSIISVIPKSFIIGTLFISSMLLVNPLNAQSPDGNKPISPKDLKINGQQVILYGDKYSDSTVMDILRHESAARVLGLFYAPGMSMTPETEQFILETVERASPQERLEFIDMYINLGTREGFHTTAGQEYVFDALFKLLETNGPVYFLNNYAHYREMPGLADVNYIILSALGELTKTGDALNYPPFINEYKNFPGFEELIMENLRVKSKNNDYKYILEKSQELTDVEGVFEYVLQTLKVLADKKEYPTVLTYSQKYIANARKENNDMNNKIIDAFNAVFLESLQSSATEDPVQSLNYSSAYADSMNILNKEEIILKALTSLANEKEPVTALLFAKNHMNIEGSSAIIETAFKRLQDDQQNETILLLGKDYRSIPGVNAIISETLQALLADQQFEKTLRFAKDYKDMPGVDAIIVQALNAITPIIGAENTLALAKDHMDIDEVAALANQLTQTINMQRSSLSSISTGIFQTPQEALEELHTLFRKFKKGEAREIFKEAMAADRNGSLFQLKSYNVYAEIYAYSPLINRNHRKMLAQGLMDIFVVKKPARLFNVYRRNAPHITIENGQTNVAVSSEFWGPFELDMDFYETFQQSIVRYFGDESYDIFLKNASMDHTGKAFTAIDFLMATFGKEKALELLRAASKSDKTGNALNNRKTLESRFTPQELSGIYQQAFDHNSKAAINDMKDLTGMYGKTWATPERFSLAAALEPEATFKQEDLIVSLWGKEIAQKILLIAARHDAKGTAFDKINGSQLSQETWWMILSAASEADQTGKAFTQFEGSLKSVPQHIKSNIMKNASNLNPKNALQSIERMQELYGQQWLTRDMTYTLAMNVSKSDPGFIYRMRHKLRKIFNLTELSELIMSHIDLAIAPRAQDDGGYTSFIVGAALFLGNDLIELPLEHTRFSKVIDQKVPAATPNAIKTSLAVSAIRFCRFQQMDYSDLDIFARAVDLILDIQKTQESVAVFSPERNVINLAGLETGGEAKDKFSLDYMVGLAVSGGVDPVSNMQNFKEGTQTKEEFRAALRGSKGDLTFHYSGHGSADSLQIFDGYHVEEFGNDLLARGEDAGDVFFLSFTCHSWDFIKNLEQYLGSLKFRAGEFESSLAKAQALINAISQAAGTPVPSINSIEDAVSWLNNSADPFTIYTNLKAYKGSKGQVATIDAFIKTFRDAESRKLIENKNWSKLVQTPDGQRLKRVILETLYPEAISKDQRTIGENKSMPKLIVTETGSVNTLGLSGPYGFLNGIIQAKGDKKGAVTQKDLMAGQTGDVFMVQDPAFFSRTEPGIFMDLVKKHFPRFDISKLRIPTMLEIGDGIGKPDLSIPAPVINPTAFDAISMNDKSTDTKKATFDEQYPQLNTILSEIERGKIFRWEASDGSFGPLDSKTLQGQQATRSTLAKEMMSGKNVWVWVATPKGANRMEVPRAFMAEILLNPRDPRNMFTDLLAYHRSGNPVTIDNASTEKTDKSDLGGIDLNARTLELKRTGHQIQFDVPADLQNIDPDSIQGLTPQTISIKPVADFNALLNTLSQ